MFPLLIRITDLANYKNCNNVLEKSRLVKIAIAFHFFLSKTFFKRLLLTGINYIKSSLGTYLNILWRY